MPSTPQDPDAKKRKNNPEQLRHTLLICAKNLIAKDGISQFSMQKVADLANSSKGGLFHHFKSKEELTTAVVDLFLAQLNTALLADIHSQKEHVGVMTTAYVRVFFCSQIGLRGDWANIVQVIAAEPPLYERWQAWQRQFFGQFSHTDSDVRLMAIRHAVDGAWLGGVKDDTHLNLLQNYLLTLIMDINKENQP